MFKAGDEVFYKSVVTEIDGHGDVWIDCRCFKPSDLIPASRVTVAKARRAAEFPKDWGKMAWFSDDGKDWEEAKLVGCDMESSYGQWLDGNDLWHKFCEVEE